MLQQATHQNVLDFSLTALIYLSHDTAIWAGDFNCWLNPLTDHIPSSHLLPSGHMEFGNSNPGMD